MAFRQALINFSKGEIAEELIARIDVASYNASAKQARNVIILKYGGLTKRPGTRLVAKAYDSTLPVRLFPFQFSLTQAYALEFGQGYMRPAANGGLVLEQPLTITAITKAVNAQVTVAFHGFSVGDQIYFNNVAGMVEINGLFANVKSVVDANNFVIDIDTTQFSTFTGDSGGIVNTGAPPPPPTPPVVPPVVPPPSPPATGGGGSYSDTGGGLRAGGGHVSSQ
jgi:hypothetical protein